MSGSGGAATMISDNGDLSMGIRHGLAFLIVFAGGCATTESEAVSLRTWQQSVERYVWEQGNGDPVVLRDMSWDDVHKGFALMSDALPDRSTDAVGLLLAHRAIEGRFYFIFLFGLMGEQAVRDVRAVALNVERGEFHWAVGPPRPDATAAYRRIGGRAESPVTRFPSQSDAFRVVVTGARVSIVHEQSAATWDVNVPQQTLDRSPAVHSIQALNRAHDLRNMR